ncbi:MAG: hypothetical protein AVO35_08225 [Candidatus Aegiribacteria sp. MLS_C]|nr:MAG: hypothetical protein AVO35_08225 [Candidatus Aegiribacteria sp. MLS_C]
MEDRSWGAVIVAAGSGVRFGAGIPKQFLRLGDKAVVDWSLGAFMSIGGISEIVVVVPGEADWRRWWNPPDGVVTVPGGTRRQDSVMSGLRALVGSEFVLVHDAARPLVRRELIERVMLEALRSGAAVPVVPVRDTVKRLDPGSFLSPTVPREDLRFSQTPQAFRLDELREVLGSSGEVTDECSAMEFAGRQVAAVPGDPLNMKITDPVDLGLVRCIAGEGYRETRTGTGLDFHPFEDGRPLVLAGCRLRSDRGLAGHSDGDAVLHAASDAILAAARLGDIGVHFPPGDPEWKDADSSLMLGRCVTMAREAGWTVSQLDLTIIAVTPRIAPIRDLALARLSEITGLPVERIWIKGTTTNSLGDIGRGLGVGCMALAVLERTHRNIPAAGNNL